MVSIDEAFKSTDRVHFVPEELTGQAHFDMPLPIGFGQTISQPSTVEMMPHWLEAEAGNKVLDVGSGSGWTTALLSKIVGSKGQVYAVERIPELVKFGRNNCAKLNIANAEFHEAGKTYGLAEHAPYDRILVSAAAQSLPKELLAQLKVAGKLVIPVKSDILEITKTSEQTYETSKHPGFIFVDLI